MLEMVETTKEATAEKEVETVEEEVTVSVLTATVETAEEEMEGVVTEDLCYNMHVL